MKVYIVCHEIGEYSDYRHSIVSAHSTEEKAQAAIDFTNAETLRELTERWNNAKTPEPGGSYSFVPRWQFVWDTFRQDGDIFYAKADNKYYNKDAYLREISLEKYLEDSLSDSYQGYYSIVEMEVDE